MAYIPTNLMPGEKLVIFRRPHWVVFFWPGFWFCAGVAAQNFDQDFKRIGYVLLVLAAVVLLSSMTKYFSTEFGITTRRVISKKGLIKREAIEVFLDRIEGIHVHQGIWGRILGYGTVIVSGTGGMKDRIERVPSPLDFRTEVQRRIPRFGQLP